MVSFLPGTLPLRSNAILYRKVKSLLRRYIVVGPLGSQIEKVFALLVESGAAYCALWVRFSLSRSVGPYDNLRTSVNSDLRRNLGGRD